MNKALLPIAVGAVVVVVAAALLLSNRATQSPETAPNTQNPTGGATSLDALMALGQNQQCSFRDVETGDEVEVFISGNNMRSDFVSTSGDEAVNGHMILTGELMYVWMDGQEQGFKTSKSASAALTSQMQSVGVADTVDTSQEVDYDCRAWSTDNSKFTLPAGIEFIDINDLTQGGAMMQGDSETEVDADAKAEQCEACNSLPAEAAKSCKSVLGC